MTPKEFSSIEQDLNNLIQKLQAAAKNGYSKGFRNISRADFQLQIQFLTSRVKDIQTKLKTMEQHLK